MIDSQIWKHFSKCICQSICNMFKYLFKSPTSLNIPGPGKIISLTSHVHLPVCSSVCLLKVKLDSRRTTEVNKVWPQYLPYNIGSEQKWYGIKIIIRRCQCVEHSIVLIRKERIYTQPNIIVVQIIFQDHITMNGLYDCNNN